MQDEEGYHQEVRKDLVPYFDGCLVSPFLQAGKFSEKKNTDQDRDERVR